MGESLQDSLDQIALTEEQRDLVEDGFDKGFWADAGANFGATIIPEVISNTTFTGMAASYSLATIYSYATRYWPTLDGDIEERGRQLIEKIKQDVYEGADHEGEYSPDNYK